jgi:hypothetical protein
MADTNYDEMNSEQLTNLLREREVAGRSSMTTVDQMRQALRDADATSPTEEDPWSAEGDGQTSPLSEDELAVIAARSALDPVHNDVLNTQPLAPFDTDPLITVRSPEGATFTAPASLQPQYEEMGFEVVVGAEAFGDNGTLTTQADETWVKFGQMERAVAEKQLRR